MAPLLTRLGQSFGFGKGPSGPACDDSGPLSITGGSVNPTGLSPGNGYKFHTFTSSGTLTVSGSGNVELLCIGGGGAGSGGFGGGGGAGALIYRQSVPVSVCELSLIHI